jgi:hypothetical protein
MQTSFRELITALHGLGFGALFLLGFSGALAIICRIRAPATPEPNLHERRLLRVYLVTMVILAWATVLSGAYIVYPWYRVKPPAGVTDLAAYPQRHLLASPTTAGWHKLGMEWKEHVAWFAPIALTMVAYVCIKYGSGAPMDPKLRNVVFAFALVAFLAAAVAGLFGALINKRAPIEGGGAITLMGDVK